MKISELINSPLTLRNITLPGRIARSATELFCSFPDGHVHPYEVETYHELSSSGAGLLISAHTCVSPEGRSNKWQNAAWSDEFLGDCRDIVKAAKSDKNVPIVLQLGHGGMKGEGNNGGLPVLTPDNMTHEQIRGVVRAFGAAAYLAKRAGFDGVELHGAHMYLLSQCFYAEYNHRTDGYGGSPLNRFRITREVFEEIKLRCGKDFPVLMKINGDDRENTAEYHRGLVEVLNLCFELGMDAAEISGWSSARRGVPEKPYFLDNIGALSRETSLPLIAVGGVRRGEDIAAYLAPAEDVGKPAACAVSMARPFLQNPHVIKDLEKGMPSGCTGCCACFGPLDVKAQPIVRCAHRK